jgi:integrase
LAKVGRKSIPFRTSWGEVVDGLYRRPDGRWRVVATGQEFTEHDEHVAVAKYRQWHLLHHRREVELPADAATIEEFHRNLTLGAKFSVTVQPNAHPTGKADFVVTERALYAWMRQQLLERPEYAAQQTGIPQLARLSDFPIPRDSIKLSALWKTYDENAEVKKGSKRHVRRAWNEFLALTGAKTLRDLRPEVLVAYAKTVKEQQHDADYIADIFSRVKRVVKFGKRYGFDTVEIDAFISRAAVLFPPRSRPKYRPSPITREDFHKLLGAATDIEAAGLLFGLNACMYISEFLDVDWPEIDFEGAVYMRDREKTGVIRAATLWPITIEAIRRIPQAPGAVFKSSHGAAYHPESYRKLFAALRERAGVSETVEFNNVRDGAYTYAARHGIEERLAEIFAGHLTRGQSSRYIARNPWIVKPACDAVYQHYFGDENTGGISGKTPLA